jgi:TatA/E family protein of Tat protein translocase
MFGSIGFPELILIFIVVLLVFGPDKLPEFAKLLGKTIREFRSTVDQAKAAIEDEMYKEGMADSIKSISRDVKEALNITGDIGKDVKDALDAGGGLRSDLKDAMDIYGGIDDQPAGESEKKDDGKKS